MRCFKTGKRLQFRQHKTRGLKTKQVIPQPGHFMGNYTKVLNFGPDESSALETPDDGAVPKNINNRLQTNL